MRSNPTHATPWPRGLSREEAASYVGLGTTYFDQLIVEGKLPKPIRLGKRAIWDLRDLDAAFDSFKESVPNLEEQPKDENEWDEILGAT